MNDRALEAIALQLTPGIGVKGAVHLLDVFGDARSIFAASLDELIGQAELRRKPAEAIVRREGFAAAERELRYCAKHGITPVASTDDAYPPLLREIPDYPCVLYVQGEPAALRRPSLAVVGTRSASVYGTEQCRRLVCALIDRVPDLGVVSDLADGIDIAAHRAALEAGSGSVAVLANVLPAVSPAYRVDVARQLLDHGGALVSELHSGCKQKGEFYVSRNRLIAGLTAGCLVVESPAGGGALGTAQLADGYHRAVMAVPGRPTDPACAGTNHLIRTRLAQLVCTADDILDTLLWDLGPSPEAFREPPVTQELTADEAALLPLFGSDPISIDALCDRSGFDAGRVAAAVIGLEAARCVRRAYGNSYIKE